MIFNELIIDWAGDRPIVIDCHKLTRKAAVRKYCTALSADHTANSFKSNAIEREIYATILRSFDCAIVRSCDPTNVHRSALIRIDRPCPALHTAYSLSPPRTALDSLSSPSRLCLSLSVASSNLPQRLMRFYRNFVWLLYFFYVFIYLFAFSFHLFYFFSVSVDFLWLV